MTSTATPPSHRQPRPGPVNGTVPPGAGPGIAAPTATPRPAAATPARGTARNGTGEPSGAVPAVDAELQKAVRQSGHLRRGFYAVVLLVALAGQVTGAMQTLRIPLLFAVPAVAALELGGVVVFTNA